MQNTIPLVMAVYQNRLSIPKNVGYKPCKCSEMVIASPLLKSPFSPFEPHCDGHKSFHLIGSVQNHTVLDKMPGYDWLIKKTHKLSKVVPATLPRGHYRHGCPMNQGWTSIIWGSDSALWGWGDILFVQPQRVFFYQ